MSINNRAKSKFLLKAIKQFLLPALDKEGFVARELYAFEKAHREWVVGYPFGRHIRPTKNGVEVLEIERGKREPSEFNIWFAFFPISGTVGTENWCYGQHFPIEKASVSEADVQYVLGRSKTSGDPFRVWYWPWESPKQEDYNSLVSEVVLLLPQVTSALREGKIGPNVYRSGMR